MHYTIYILEQTISDLEPYRDDGGGTAEQIAELKEAIAILEKHAAKVPAAPPEFVRDYPNASD
jgi:hypothetical protein